MWRSLGFLAMASTLWAAPNPDPFPQSENIKGLQVQMAEDALELGIQHAAINVNLSALLATEENAAALTVESDGYRFRLNSGYLESLERQIQPLSDRGVVVYVILLAYPTGDAKRDAVVLHPGALSTKASFQIAGFNNVTPEGRAYLRAVVELLASRWSGAKTKAARVWGWIVGNEINSHGSWYQIGPASPEEVVRHYEEAFRIIHGAVRTASAAARLYMSFEHHWTLAAEGQGPFQAVSGRELLDRFAARVRERGDLDWHVAWHPYPENLGNPRTWADVSAQDRLDTPRITFKNLEVLVRYLDQSALHWQGRSRRIILSEQGFHTLPGDDGERLQAAAFVYAWEKCQKLPAVDAFIYHRHVDHAHEGGLLLGLWSHVPGSIATPHQKKRLWEVFRKAGTADWKSVVPEFDSILSPSSGAFR